MLVAVGWWTVLALVLTGALTHGWAVSAQDQASFEAPAPRNVAAGLRIFTQKADCQACHGWAADGRKMDSQMPNGSNLRDSKLNREALAGAIRCGRPGREMPAFDRLAYSDGRCFGWTEADLRERNLTLPDPAATLQPREIDRLVDFLMAKVIGQGAIETRAACVEYWGEDVELCGELPD